MEAHPATCEKAPPIAKRFVLLPTNQTLNNCAKRDKGREGCGQLCRKWMKVLNNAKQLAFRGWKGISELWTYEKCKQYIKWCHVRKAFNRDRYLVHRSTGRANLKFCKNPDFLERCIQVYQYLFNKEKVERNEVSYKLYRMIWSEIALEKRIDWRSYRVDARVTLPPSRDIPSTRKYPNRGLGIT